MKEKIRSLSNTDLVQLYRLLLTYLEIIEAEKKTEEAGEQE